MLVLADYKTQQAGVNIEWLHGLAEDTGFEECSFDLVTASFLLHETPPKISQLILQECFRLTKPGGQVIILDGNQKRLRHAKQKQPNHPVTFSPHSPQN
jgi:ubiquinone/menaquinone biosynthesis C-methylase UbiE